MSVIPVLITAFALSIVVTIQLADCVTVADDCNSACPVGLADGCEEGCTKALFKCKASTDALSLSSIILGCVCVFVLLLKFTLEALILFLYRKEQKTITPYTKSSNHSTRSEASGSNPSHAPHHPRGSQQSAARKSTDIEQP